MRSTSVSCLPESLNHVGLVSRPRGWLTHAVVRVWAQQQTPLQVGWVDREESQGLERVCLCVMVGLGGWLWGGVQVSRRRRRRRRRKAEDVMCHKEQKPGQSDQTSFSTLLFSSLS